MFRNQQSSLGVVSESLLGSEIHGFHTMEDLDMEKILQEASSRWLRPNEIHAILCNSSKFTVYVKPLDSPQSGTLVLFDRKVLRNFRKDGHVWKKKSDGKTVKEAHEHLKVGDKERIHVYYAHGQDKPNFVRRCYWLLDKKLEHTVLVHYREILEDDAIRKGYTEPVLLSGSNISPSSPLYLASSSPVSGTSATHPSSGTLVEKAYTIAKEFYAGGESDAGETMISGTIGRMNQELVSTDSTFEWEDLLQPQIFSTPLSSVREEASGGEYVSRGYEENVSYESVVSDLSNINSFHVEPSSTPCLPQVGNFIGKGDKIMKEMEHGYVPSAQQQSNSSIGTPGMPREHIFQSQGSFGRWMNSVLDHPWDPLIDEQLVLRTPTGQDLKPHLANRMPQQEQIFSIVEALPLRGLATEWTKVLIVGNFHKSYLHLSESKIFCVFGDALVPAEMVQAGVLRCSAPPQSSGLYNFYISCDGGTPISQVMCFEYYTVSVPSVDCSPAPKLNENKWNSFELKRRLAHLLYSTTSGMSNFTRKMPSKASSDAKRFLQSTSLHEKEWISLSKTNNDDDSSFLQSNLSLLDLTLKLKLQEWLLEKIVEGGGASVRDQQGQGIIHLGTILNCDWAIHLISQAGTPIDFRDAKGWTALHWAASLGRKEMVAILLREGADPSLVSDPSPEFPGGCTPADLASKNGYDGLAAYLAEKGLTKHFQKMSLAGNVEGTIQPDGAVDSMQFPNISEEDLELKDSLAALRTAADAASRIQEAFRQRSLKLREELAKENNDKDEARRIISALKIQHAFQRHRERKQLNAAMRIQQKFRVWKARKDFLHLRRQVIKIQAAYRGHQVRRQYHKIIWSVGIVEKAILRWRLKKKGLRGHHVDPVVAEAPGDNVDDFFKISQKQAEDRVERSVTRVQAMFRSHRARAEYRNMKLLYEQAMLEQGEPVEEG